MANEWSRISGQIRLVKTDYETRSTLEGGAVFNVYEWDAKANAYREDPVDTLVYDADAKVYLSTILQRRDRAKDKRQNDGKYKIVEDYPIDGYANGVFDEEAEKVDEPWSKEIEITDSMSFDTLNYFDLTVANKENEYHIKTRAGKFLILTIHIDRNGFLVIGSFQMEDCTLQICYRFSITTYFLDMIFVFLVCYCQIKIVMGIKGR